MIRNDWNPELYLKFDNERTQPAIDLISRIDFSNPSKILDVGCGPGNSTQMLAARWPDSRITGLDNSPAMINRAAKDYPDQDWIIADAGKENIPGIYDIIFSNAAIQWIPDHYSLFSRLKESLNSNGILAVQIPLFFEMPLGKSIRRISIESKWADTLTGANGLFTIHTPAEYYDILSGLFSKIDIWQTDYVHVMDSHEAILQMIKSTGLKPYLDLLEKADEKTELEKMVLEEIKKDYPLQQNKKALLPFKRLFFIAKP